MYWKSTVLRVKATSGWFLPQHPRAAPRRMMRIHASDWAAVAPSVYRSRLRPQPSAQADRLRPGQEARRDRAGCRCAARALRWNRAFDQVRLDRVVDARDAAAVGGVTF